MVKEAKWLLVMGLFAITEIMFLLSILDRPKEDQEIFEDKKSLVYYFYEETSDEPIATYRTGKSDSCTIENFHEMNDLSIFADRGELGKYVDHYKCVRVEVEEEGQSREVNFYEANTDHLIASYYESEQGDYCTSSRLHHENSLSVLQGDVTITYLCVTVEVI